MSGRNSVPKLIAVFLLAALCQGCGSKGPLVLPQDPLPKQEPPPKQQPTPDNTTPRQ